MNGPAENDPRVYFAAERTFLAWIRTGLGLMGVGFAVSRFGLFLRQFMAGEAHANVHASSHSLWSGVALVVLGVIVNIAATVRHVQVVHELSSGSWVPGRASKSAVALALLLAAIGLIMAAYLIFIR